MAFFFLKNYYQVRIKRFDFFALKKIEKREVSYTLVTVMENDKFYRYRIKFTKIYYFATLNFIHILITSIVE